MDNVVIVLSLHWTEELLSLSYMKQLYCWWTSQQTRGTVQTSCAVIVLVLHFTEDKRSPKHPYSKEIGSLAARDG